MLQVFSGDLSVRLDTNKERRELQDVRRGGNAVEMCLVKSAVIRIKQTSHK